MPRERLQQEERQERLLELIGWLYEKHGGRPADYSTGFNEFRFRREDLAGAGLLDQYAPAHGDGGQKALARDLKVLAVFGFVVEHDFATDEWVSRAVQFSDRERRALAIAALSVAVQNSAGPSYLVGSGITPQAAVVFFSSSPLVDTLIDAIRERLPVTLTHRGDRRRVHPWGLTWAQGVWFLIAWDLLRQAQRTFVLSAISTVEPETTSGSFIVPQIDLEAAADELLDPDRWVKAEAVTVRVRVEGPLADRACRLLHAETCGEPDHRGWVPLECEVHNREQFMIRLFGLRARAVVEAPPEIRSMVMERLRAMAEKTT